MECFQHNLENILCVWFFNDANFFTKGRNGFESLTLPGDFAFLARQGFNFAGSVA